MLIIELVKMTTTKSEANFIITVLIVHPTFYYRRRYEYYGCLEETRPLPVWLALN